MRKASCRRSEATSAASFGVFLLELRDEFADRLVDEVDPDVIGRHAAEFYLRIAQEQPRPATDSRSAGEEAAEDAAGERVREKDSAGNSDRGDEADPDSRART